VIDYILSSGAKLIFHFHQQKVNMMEVTLSCGNNPMDFLHKYILQKTKQTNK